MLAACQGFTAGVTNFLWPGGGARNTSFASSQIRNTLITSPVTVSKIGFVVDQPGQALATVTITVFKNGVASALTANFAADNNTGSVVVGTPVSFVQGDRLAVAITQTASTTTGTEVGVTIG
jgi:hypothetical protein